MNAEAMIASQKIAWQDAYETGDAEVDRQHRHLVELANLLIDAVETGKGRKVARYAFKALLAYTQEHFDYEEKVLADRGSPSLEDQHTEHRTLLQELCQVFTDNESVDEARLAGILAGWVQERLLPHLCIQDVEAFGR